MIKLPKVIKNIALENIIITSFSCSEIKYNVYCFGDYLFYNKPQRELIKVSEANQFVL